jgi:hypothetical protein
VSFICAKAGNVLQEFNALAGRKFRQGPHLAIEKAEQQGPVRLTTKMRLEKIAQCGFHGKIALSRAPEGRGRVEPHARQLVRDDMYPVHAAHVRVAQVSLATGIRDTGPEFSAASCPSGDKAERKSAQAGRHAVVDIQFLETAPHIGIDRINGNLQTGGDHLV